MKFKITCVVFLFTTICIKAQTVSKQVIGSSGLEFANNIYTTNFTVGEVIVGKVENGSVINQGFWANLVNDETLSLSASLLKEVNVYPNPVADFIQIKFNTNHTKKYLAQLFDSLGKQVFSTAFWSYDQVKLLNVSNVQTGVYFLKITEIKSNYNKTLKILKQ